MGKTDPLVDALDGAQPALVGSQLKVDREFGPEVHAAILRAYERRLSPSEIAKLLSESVPVGPDAVTKWLKRRGAWRD